VRVAAEVRNGATHEDITGPRTTCELRRWCARGDDGRPFFAFVHLWDVHYDYNPPKPYAEMFDPGYTGTLTGKAYMENTAITAPLMKENPRDFQHLLALYDGEIRFTDDNLKTILALLEARAGGKERMCLVITADHGEGFFEHGIKGHHQALWDELIKVPLVVRFPGSIAPGRLIHEQVRTVDLFPTLAKIGHAAIPSYLPGRDLVALAQATTPITGEPTLVELLNRGADLQILRTSTIKVRRMKLSKEYRGFLLDRDPGEITPVDQRNPDIAAAGAELEKWLHDVSALRTKLAADPQKIEVDPKLENRLRSLGYTEGK
jgi:arylsulfatase A-like enzyme